MLTHLSDLIVACNVGIMLFFSVAVAPTIFVVLPQEWASAYVRSFFPKYYLFLGATTATAAALAAAPAMQTGLAVCAFLFFFSRFWLTPRVNKARDEKKAQTFKILHFLSVALNMLQLAFFIWVLFISVKAA
jgi:hypothetical protein